MAKKQKIELTPEEKTAKKIRHSNGWVRFWAIIVSLALTLVIFSAAKNGIGAPKAEKTAVTNANSSNTNSSNNTSNNNNSSSSNNNNSSSSNNTASGDNSSSGNTGAANTGAATNEAEELVKALNAATAAAAKGSYTWTRDRNIDGDIDVGGMTKAVDTAIKIFDKSENAGLSNTVGWFVEITRDGVAPNSKVVNGAWVDEGYDDYELMMPTKLTANDIKVISAKDGSYEFTIPDVTNPKRDAAAPLSRLTNDFLTEEDVAAALEKETSGAVTVSPSTVEYSNVKAKATIKEGKLTAYTISYYAKVNPLVVQLPKLLGISLGTVEGYGALNTTITYTF